jgi:hypothetical protein
VDAASVYWTNQQGGTIAKAVLDVPQHHREHRYRCEKYGCRTARYGYRSSRYSYPTSRYGYRSRRYGYRSRRYGYRSRRYGYRSVHSDVAGPRIR